MELERGLLRFKLFLSTPSARRATSASAGRKCPGSDFYPRPPRGGRHFLWRPRCKAVPISIHALREEGDQQCCRRNPGEQNFYPRPPRGGRPNGMEVSRNARNFYPRPPRGGRRGNFRRWPTDLQISIHALREEGDVIRALVKKGAMAFLSTPSARRATTCPSFRLGLSRYFYPRPPRGGRLSTPCSSAQNDTFLSTPSARRATGHLEDMTMKLYISIHALREEGDVIHIVERCKTFKFLSTPSARRATLLRAVYSREHGISIHALREESDPRGGMRKMVWIFLSTPSARRAT